MKTKNGFATFTRRIAAIIAKSGQAVVYMPPRSSIWRNPHSPTARPSGSKYLPHQGAKECTRRRRQLSNGLIQA